MAKPVAQGRAEHGIASLLLGLYDAHGVLHYVGGTSSFKTAERRRLVEVLEPYRGPSGFGQGRTPGEPNRWTGERAVSDPRLWFAEQYAS
jgi:ATP-dependent DNA ligase